MLIIVPLNRNIFWQNNSHITWLLPSTSIRASVMPFAVSSHSTVTSRWIIQYAVGGHHTNNVTAFCRSERSLTVSPSSTRSSTAATNSSNSDIFIYRQRAWGCSMRNTSRDIHNFRAGCWSPVSSGSRGGKKIHGNGACGCGAPYSANTSHLCGKDWKKHTEYNELLFLH